MSLVKKLSTFFSFHNESFHREKLRDDFDYHKMRMIFLITIKQTFFCTADRGGNWQNLFSLETRKATHPGPRERPTTAAFTWSKDSQLLGHTHPKKSVKASLYLSPHGSSLHMNLFVIRTTQWICVISRDILVSFSSALLDAYRFQFRLSDINPRLNTSQLGSSLFADS